MTTFGSLDVASGFDSDDELRFEVDHTGAYLDRASVRGYAMSWPAFSATSRRQHYHAHWPCRRATRSRSPRRRPAD